MISGTVPPKVPSAEIPVTEDGLPLTERWAALALLAIGVLFRFLYIWHFRIDSDEPQHLHVVWAWSQGMLPYRDVFDNHSPLFQALCAPLFHLLGQRADIVLPMRAGQLPIWGLTIFCVWKIASALYSARIALWTAVLAALFPPFYLDSIEFRPDQLWTLAWMLILLVLTTGRVTARRAFLAGVLCGLAFSVSMKTTLLLAALIQGFVGALVIRRISGGLPYSWLRLLRCAGAGLAGIPLIPALVILFFQMKGALPDMYYCVIQHNILPSSGTHAMALHSSWRWLAGVGVAAAGGFAISQMPLSISSRTRIGFLYCAAVLYYATLIAFWPVITAEDYLPFFPAAMLSAAPLALWLVALALRNTPVLAGSILGVAELIGVFVMASPFQDQTADKIGLVADTLKLTAPEDFVMDSKGETIYRNRPFKYVFESLTFHRMQQGLISDDVAAQLVEKHVPVSVTRRMPHGSRDFIKSNYLPIAWRLLAAGKFIRVGVDHSNRPVKFDVAVPQRYTFVTSSGSPTGTLDDTPFTGPRELAAGPHTFVPEVAQGDIALIWASVPEHGYSPFATIKKDITTPQD